MKPREVYSTRMQTWTYPICALVEYVRSGWLAPVVDTCHQFHNAWLVTEYLASPWWQECAASPEHAMGRIPSSYAHQLLKGLSHLADLARRSYTGAQIWWFSGISTSTAAQRYHIAKNDSTSSGHRQNIGEKISNGRRRYKFLNMLKNFCRCAASTPVWLG